MNDGRRVQDDGEVWNTQKGALFGGTILDMAMNGFMGEVAF